MLTHIGDLADAGERMTERLRRKAFLPVIFPWSEGHAGLAGHALLGLLGS